MKQPLKEGKTERTTKKPSHSLDDGMSLENKPTPPPTLTTLVTWDRKFPYGLNHFSFLLLEQEPYLIESVASSKFWHMVDINKYLLAIVFLYSY